MMNTQPTQISPRTRVGRAEAFLAFDRELSQHDDDRRSSWYDYGMEKIRALASELTASDLRSLNQVWRKRRPAWQCHCAEVLAHAKLCRPEAARLLLDIASGEDVTVALDALVSLRAMGPDVVTEQQWECIVGALGKAEIKPTARVPGRVLAHYLTRLRNQA